MHHWSSHWMDWIDCRPSDHSEERMHMRRRRIRQSMHTHPTPYILRCRYTTTRCSGMIRQDMSQRRTRHLSNQIDMCTVQLMNHTNRDSIPITQREPGRRHSIPLDTRLLRHPCRHHMSKPDPGSLRHRHTCTQRYLVDLPGVPIDIGRDPSTESTIQMTDPGSKGNCRCCQYST
jgi:hypothetical protein